MVKVVEIDFEKLRRELWGKSAQVARVLGLAPENLSRKLRGHHRLTLEELNQIALHLDRDVSDFLLFRAETSEHPGGTDDSEEIKMQEERVEILRMLEKKQISLEEAERLLDALEEGTLDMEGASTPEPPGSPGELVMPVLPQPPTGELAMPVPPRPPVLPQFPSPQSSDAGTMQALRENLRHPSEDVCLQAVAALRERSGVEAASALAQALRHPSEEVRRQAVSALGEMGGVEAATALGEAVRDSSEAVCLQAVAALREMSGTEVVKALAQAVRHPGEEVRRQAVAALGKFGGVEAVPVLADAVRDVSEKVRLEAVSALREIGGVEAASALAKAFDNSQRNESPQRGTELNQFSIDDVIRLSEHDVEIDWLKGLRDAGITDLSIDQIIDLSDHGVEVEWLKGLHEAGFSNLSVGEIVRLADHGVEIDWLKELQEAGITSLSTNQLIQLAEK